MEETSNRFSDIECKPSSKLEQDHFDFPSMVDSDHTYAQVETECIDVNKNVDSEMIVSKQDVSFEVMGENDDSTYKLEFGSESVLDCGLVNVTKTISSTDLKISLEPQVITPESEIIAKLNELDADEKVKRNDGWCISRKESVKKTKDNLTGSLLDCNVAEKLHYFSINEEVLTENTNENPKIRNNCSISKLGLEQPLDIPLDVKNEFNYDILNIKGDTNNRDISRKECVKEVNEEKTNENLLDYNVCEALCSYPFNEEVLEKHTDEKFEITKHNSSISELSLEQALIIPPDVVRNLIHCQVEPSASLEVSQLLSKYCHEKLKDIIVSAIKYKERWGRKKLTSADFNKGLMFCSEKPSNFTDFYLSQQKKKPKTVNLFEQLSVIKAKPSVLSKSKTCITEAWLGKKDPLSKTLSKLPRALRTYFDLITKAVSLHVEYCAVALEDLKLNKNILDLAAHFVCFITTEMLKQSSDFSRLSSLLKVIHSLLLNPCLYFGQECHLNTLAYLLLKCLLVPSQNLNLSGDSWLMKDTTGKLLSHVLKRNQSKKLWFEIIFILEATLCDKEKSPVSHYGALFVLNAIGVPAIKLALLPHIDEYIKHLNSAHMSDYKDQCNTCAVRGQLMCSYYLLISDFLKGKTDESSLYADKFQYHSSHVQETKESEVLLQASFFLEYFGDSLVPYFPFFVSCSMNFKKKEPQNVVKNRVHNKIKHWIPKKDSADNNKPVSNLGDYLFDYHPIKKPVIKFGKINNDSFL